MLEIKPPNTDIERWREAHNGEWITVDPARIQTLIESRGSPRAQEKYVQSIGPIWMTYNRSLGREAFQKILNYVFRKHLLQLKDQEELSALEIGCSENASLSDLLSNFYQGRTTVTDIHPASVWKACKKFSALRPLCSSYHALALKDASMDFVFEGNAFDMTCNLEQCLAEVARVLKPGGYFLGFQDVVPNEIASLGRIFDGNPVRIYRSNDLKDDITPLLLEVDGEVWDPISFHFEEVGKVGLRVGLECLCHHLFNASLVCLRSEERKRMERRLGRWKNVDYLREANVFRSAYGLMKRDFDAQIPPGHDRYQVTANIVVLKKGDAYDCN